MAAEPVGATPTWPPLHCNTSTFQNCWDAANAGCPAGEYNLRSCEPGQDADGQCTLWRTQCDDGWTLIAYQAKDHDTSSNGANMRSATAWPRESSSRTIGDSFLFQSPTTRLQVSFGALEAVACNEATEGPAALRRSCGGNWVHSVATKFAASHVSSILASYGYEDTSTPPDCADGKVFGLGTTFTACTPYAGQAHPSVLGWQIDVTVGGSCWMGRGNCCSSAGGTGVCGSDADGQHYGMLWVK